MITISETQGIQPKGNTTSYVYDYPTANFSSLEITGIAYNNENQTNLVPSITPNLGESETDFWTRAGQEVSAAINTRLGGSYMPDIDFIPVQVALISYVSKNQGFSDIKKMEHDILIAIKDNVTTFTKWVGYKISQIDLTCVPCRKDNFNAQQNIKQWYAKCP